MYFPDDQLNLMSEVASKAKDHVKECSYISEFMGIFSPASCVELINYVKELKKENELFREDVKVMTVFRCEKHEPANVVWSSRHGSLCPICKT